MAQSCRELVKYLALENAEAHGAARSVTVMGHLLARRPDLRATAKEASAIVMEEVNAVNAMPQHERRSLLLLMRSTYQMAEQPVSQEARSTLPELRLQPDLKTFRFRLAPNPDGPLTLGNARPAILCDYYSKRYEGSFILRFEDTSPSVKPPLAEAYGWVISDLEWLGIMINEVYYQSDRLPLYYERARDFIERGKAYVCLCRSDQWIRYASATASCPHRATPPKENLELFQMMLDGRLGTGSAVVRVKTEMSNPNPALRDWPALRIDEAPHPRVSTRYRVWPLYNWACAVDDHEMGITHVIRGKEHITNEARQAYVFRGFGWPAPVVLHVGRLKLEGVTLSKTRIMREMKSGAVMGLDDPRLGTLSAIRRRGFRPEVIRMTILEMGLKPVEATLKWDNLCSANRVLIDRETPRAFFVWDPYDVEIRGSPPVDTVTLPLHPGNELLGSRDLPVPRVNAGARLRIAGSDATRLSPGDRVRLMGLYNCVVAHVDEHQKLITAEFAGTSHEEAVRGRLPILQWVPQGMSVSVDVLMPDASVVEGHAEPNTATLKNGEMVQFLRFGFVRCEGLPHFVFAHQ